MPVDERATVPVAVLAPAAEARRETATLPEAPPAMPVKPVKAVPVVNPFRTSE
jgi:hypothetical protein